MCRPISNFAHVKAVLLRGKLPKGELEGRQTKGEAPALALLARGERVFVALSGNASWAVAVLLYILHLIGRQALHDVDWLAKRDTQSSTSLAPLSLSLPCISLFLCWFPLSLSTSSLRTCSILSHLLTPSVCLSVSQPALFVCACLYCWPKTKASQQDTN